MDGVLKRSQVPLYLQVWADLKYRIENGIWEKGARIPSIDALSKEFNVAQITIRQAISRLVEDKVLEAKQGKGTFVLKTPRKQQWFTIRSQTNWSSLSLRTLYSNTSTNIIDFQRDVSLPDLRQNECNAAELYAYIKRVNSRDKIPFSVNEIYIDQTVYDLNPVSFRENTVLATLDELPDVKLGKGKQVLTVETAGWELAKLLKIEVNAPIVNSKRYVFDQKEILIYYGNLHYRADHIKFEIDMVSRKSQFIKP